MLIQSMNISLACARRLNRLAQEWEGGGGWGQSRSRRNKLALAERVPNIHINNKGITRIGRSQYGQRH